MTGRKSHVANDRQETVKAVIFDVYGTLLEVKPGPADAEEQWYTVWREFFGALPALPLVDFDGACMAEVARDHGQRRGAGIAWPEVNWRTIAMRAAAELSALSEDMLDAFLCAHAKLQRNTQAMPGAPAFLARLQERGLPAGIASNAQRYTLDELANAGIALDVFTRGICFWSFEHGFSKPDPAVFAWLTDRLSDCGIRPEETLMIGDRWDNDVAPARAAGWQTWHFQGTWPDLEL